MRGRATRAPPGRRSSRTRSPAPSDVHAERHHPVHEVVAPGDRVEQLADAPGLLLALRERLGGTRHPPGSRRRTSARVASRSASSPTHSMWSRRSPAAPARSGGPRAWSPPAAACGRPRRAAPPRPRRCRPCRGSACARARRTARPRDRRARPSRCSPRARARAARRAAVRTRAAEARARTISMSAVV